LLLCLASGAEHGERDSCLDGNGRDDDIAGLALDRILVRKRRNALVYNNEPQSTRESSLTWYSFAAKLLAAFENWRSISEGDAIDAFRAIVRAQTERITVDESEFIAEKKIGIFVAVCERLTHERVVYE
jgi:hypothetical protein